MKSNFNFPAPEPVNGFAAMGQTPENPGTPGGIDAANMAALNSKPKDPNGIKLPSLSNSIAETNFQSNSFQLPPKGGPTGAMPPSGGFGMMPPPPMGLNGMMPPPMGMAPPGGSFATTTMPVPQSGGFGAAQNAPFGSPPGAPPKPVPQEAPKKNTGGIVGAFNSGLSALTSVLPFGASSSASSKPPASS